MRTALPAACVKFDPVPDPGCLMVLKQCCLPTRRNLGTNRLTGSIPTTFSQLNDLTDLCAQLGTASPLCTRAPARVWQPDLGGGLSNAAGCFAPCRSIFDNQLFGAPPIMPKLRVLCVKLSPPVSGGRIGPQSCNVSHNLAQCCLMRHFLPPPACCAQAWTGQQLHECIHR